MSGSTGPTRPSSPPSLDGKPCVTAVRFGIVPFRRGVARADRRVSCICSIPISRRTRRGSSFRPGAMAATARPAQQEIILGIGGMRAQDPRVRPDVFHLNEGHAAFVVLQRIRSSRARSSFDDALEEIRRSTVFTTHTPVAAGHDAFQFYLVEKHLAGCWEPLAPIAIVSSHWAPTTMGRGHSST